MTTGNYALITQIFVSKVSAFKQAVFAGSALHCICCGEVCVYISHPHKSLKGAMVPLIHLQPPPTLSINSSKSLCRIFAALFMKVSGLRFLSFEMLQGSFDCQLIAQMMQREAQQLYSLAPFLFYILSISSAHFYIILWWTQNKMLPLDPAKRVSRDLPQEQIGMSCIFLCIQTILI